MEVILKLDALVTKSNDDLHGDKSLSYCYFSYITQVYSITFSLMRQPTELIIICERHASVKAEQKLNRT